MTLVAVSGKNSNIPVVRHQPPRGASGITALQQTTFNTQLTRPVPAEVQVIGVSHPQHTPPAQEHMYSPFDHSLAR
jgi:hypothetical protein